MLEDSVAICVFDLVIIMLVVVVVVAAHDVVGAFVAGAWVMIEDHCSVCENKSR